MSLTFGSLFAGIGGLDLGLERSGMKCVWQVENDPYATRVLEKHWPDVRRWDDVRTFPPPGDWSCDFICGGFPCVDVSSLGKRKGFDGQTDGSGLWSEMHRIVCELRPRFVLMENVAEITFRGIGRVLGDLAESGYDVAWQCLPAGALGAPHLRDRWFALGMDRNAVSGHESALARFSAGDPLESGRSRQAGWRETESRMDRVANGIRHRVDRCRCLGNAVVPQVAEWIGNRITNALADAACEERSE